MEGAGPAAGYERGVHLDIGGGHIDFWNDDFVHLMLGKREFFSRYDPEDLSEVRIYDLEDRYIMSVPADNVAVLSYNASKDDVKAAMAKTRRLERIAREYKENAILADVDKVTAMELVLKQAERNKATYQGKPNPSLLEVQRADEEPVFKKGRIRFALIGCFVSLRLLKHKLHRSNLVHICQNRVFLVLSGNAFQSSGLHFRCSDTQ